MSIVNKLYHGSSVCSEKLIPHQAYDWGYEEGCENAVYATSNKNVALAFALGIKPDVNGKSERVMDTEFGDVMIFVNGMPNYGGVGYLHVLSSEGFTYAGGTQWINKNEVIPLEIIEIKVDEYLHLMRFATKDEINRFEEERLK
ncbi:MAG: hypothetical protein ACRC68_15695 [Clostridium sp.]